MCSAKSWRGSSSRRRCEAWSLSPAPCAGLSASSLDAFAGLTGAASRDSAPQLVERLRARLGEEAVYGVCLIPEHRPEAAWRRVHELRLNARRQLLTEPAASMQECRARYGCWTNRCRYRKPEILQGPERIESGWWDGKGVARDYYIARQSHGARLWVFQERQLQALVLCTAYSLKGLPPCTPNCTP